MKSLFYVGQRVVAVRNHPQGYFKIGDEFTVLEIAEYCCGVCIRIDDNMDMHVGTCITHGEEPPRNGRFFDQVCFAPIQDLGAMTFEDAIKFVEPKKLHDEHV